MSRGGHNWRGSGTVEGSRSLDVMKLARAGYLSGGRLGSWQWTYGDGTDATIGIVGGRARDHPRLSHQVGWRGLADRFSSVCRSAGPPAASAESDPGSSATSAPMESIAAGRLRSSMVPAGCSPAAIATSSATRCSAADPWTALIIACDACTASWARITMVRMASRLPSRSGCGGGRTRGSRCRSRAAQEFTSIRFSRSARSGYWPG